MVVGFPPGGAADILGRYAAQTLSVRLGQQVVVDNRGGAGGVIATEIVAQALPNGYTLLFTSIPHVINPHLYKKVGYDAFQGLHAGRAVRGRAADDGDERQFPGEVGQGTDRGGQGPSRGRSTTPRAATARPATWRWSCSRA